MTDDRTSDPVQLGSGQTARLHQGVVQVIQPAVPETYHFRMTTQHISGGMLESRCANHNDLLAFLRQLEALDYTMHEIARVPGEVPPCSI